VISSSGVRSTGERRGQIEMQRGIDSRIA